MKLTEYLVMWHQDEEVKSVIVNSEKALPNLSWEKLPDEDWINDFLAALAWDQFDYDWDKISIIKIQDLPVINLFDNRQAKGGDLMKW